jgi:hypothetical protein
MKKMAILAVCALVAAAFMAAPASAQKPELVIGSGAFGVEKHQDYHHTLNADTVYVLTGVYTVDSTYSLTIPAGTLIKGDSLTAGTLYIHRGAQIFAQGTECDPIVMTSRDPIGERDRGDWGGVIIAGAAPINQDEPPIEGGIVPGSYGGPDPGVGDGDPNDDSGVFSYVRIEYPGYRYADQNEINGLTMCGVGAGTQIDHVQVSYSFDDAYEWFGGTVDAKYLVAFGETDDSFDTDFGYIGRLQFLFGLKDPFMFDVAGESRGFESDNMGSYNCVTPLTQPIISNLTSIGPFRTDTSTVPPGETFDWSGVVRRCSHLELHNSASIGHERGYSIRDAVTQQNACNNCTFRQVSIATKSQTHDTGRWAGIEDWWTGAAPCGCIVGNIPTIPPGIIRSIDGMGLTDMTDLNNPNPVPIVGTELDVAGTSFVGLDPAFFDSTDYRGAFKPGTPMWGQWTRCWTNFDPQNTHYNDGITTGVGGRPSHNANMLFQNYPNPFAAASGTNIHYSVSKPGPVQIHIFDAAGRMVNTITDQAKAGENAIVWNGKDGNGNTVPSGVYFYQINADGFKAQKRMMLAN